MEKELPLKTEQNSNEAIPKTLIELLQNTSTEFRKLKDNPHPKERAEIIDKISSDLGIKIWV